MRLIVLLSGLLLTLQGWAEERFLAAKAGDIVAVSLHALHPTQKVLGFDQIYYKLGRFAREPHKLFDEYCQTNGQGPVVNVSRTASVARADSFTCQAPVGTHRDQMKTAIVGPHGQLYLTDGHHTFTSFFEEPSAGPDTQVWLLITDNFSDQPLADFWPRMQASGKVWLNDGQGAPIAPAELPRQLGFARFADDPFRSVVYFNREVAYAKPSAGAVRPEFLEFYWGQWLRGQFELSEYDLTTQRGYRTLLLDAAKAMVKLDEEQKVGLSGYTKAQLGGYAKVEYKELDKVVKNKISHVIQYKKSLAPL